MNFRIDGQRALVTGANTGIGQAIAVGLAEAGAHVLAAGRRPCDETIAQIEAAGGTGEAILMDLATPSDVAAQIATLGPLDILVNNAGITRHARDHGDLNALSKDDFMAVWEVNVVGAFLATQALKPMLLAAHEQTGRASAVLMTSSVAGVMGIGSSVAYAASKGAMNTMTKSLARGLAPQIRVNAICPGFIGTRWFKDAMDEEAFAATVDSVIATTPLEAASGPEDIADAAMFFVTDASRHVTGETMLVDAGLHLGKSPLKK